MVIGGVSENLVSGVAPERKQEEERRVDVVTPSRQMSLIAVPIGMFFRILF